MVSSIVEEIGNIRREGVIIPFTWFDHPLLQQQMGQQKVFHNIAALILAEVLYWYEPEVVRDELDPRRTKFCNRFTGPALDVDFNQWADHLGAVVDYVRKSFDFLASRDIISLKHLDRYEYKNPEGGVFVYENVTFVRPNPKTIRILNEIPDDAKMASPLRNNDLTKVPPGVEQPAAFTSRDELEKLLEADPNLKPDDRKIALDQLVRKDAPRRKRTGFTAIADVSLPRSLTNGLKATSNTLEAAVQNIQSHSEA